MAVTDARFQDRTRPISETPRIRQIEIADLREALWQGWQDFRAQPSHLAFVALIYPIAGILLAQLTVSYNIFPLLFPLAAGFALLGPFAAIGLYEISRRREQGLDSSWRHVFDVLRPTPISQFPPRRASDPGRDGGDREQPDRDERAPVGGVAAAAAADERADAKFAEALRNNQRGDNYTVLTIAFATVLFFGALSGRMRRPVAQWALLGIGTVGFLVCAGLLLWFPKLV